MIPFERHLKTLIEIADGGLRRQNCSRIDVTGVAAERGKFDCQHGGGYGQTAETDVYGRRQHTILIGRRVARFDSGFGN
jgi:hypothetical protein